MSSSPTSDGSSQRTPNNGQYMANRSQNLSPRPPSGGMRSRPNAGSRDRNASSLSSGNNLARNGEAEPRISKTSTKVDKDSSRSSSTLGIRDRVIPFETQLVERTVFPAYHLKIERKNREDGQGTFTVIDPNDDDDVMTYIERDLDIWRLDRIQKALHHAGLSVALDPLHCQVFKKGREIWVTENLDYHLVFRDSHIHIKPLPDYMLSLGFWEKISSRDDSDLMWRNAVGFLHSYVMLIRTEHDFKLAQGDGGRCPQLLPAAVKDYGKWHKFQYEFISNFDDEQFEILSNSRWNFAELDMAHLNRLYKIKPSLWKRNGIMFIYDSHYDDESFREKSELKYARWAAGFGFFSVVLTAMQVAQNTKYNHADAFKTATEWFSVFSMALPLALLIWALSQMFRQLGVTAFKQVQLHYLQDGSVWGMLKRRWPGSAASEPSQEMSGSDAQTPLPTTAQAGSTVQVVTQTGGILAPPITRSAWHFGMRNSFGIPKPTQHSPDIQIEPPAQELSNLQQDAQLDEEQRIQGRTT